MPDLLGSPDSGRGDRPLELPAPQLRPDASVTAVTGLTEVSPVAGTLAPTQRGDANGEPPLLLCQRVSKWYGPVIGVNQVSLALRSGITGLVGSNGAGKSTLMRLITGQLRPDIGSIHIAGHEAWSTAGRRFVGYCPEVDVFYEEMSGRQFVETMARLWGFTRAEARRRSEHALEQVDMIDRADRRLAGYSKGMRQRIKLAQALLHDPPLLILDEPLSGIDPVGRWQLVSLFRTLAESGKCLLISSHELEELEKLTDHVAIMARGRIATVGTVAQIRDRLDEHPLLIRIDLRNSPLEKSAVPAASCRHRDLAAALFHLQDVVGVELVPNPGEEDVGHLLVRARNPQRFFSELTRLVLEEWLEISLLQTLDDSTHAVLGYLLGGRAT